MECREILSKAAVPSCLSVSELALLFHTCSTACTGIALGFLPSYPLGVLHMCIEGIRLTSRCDHAPEFRQSDHGHAVIHVER